MQINEVIRKYRKENHLTQEEMANRLGVTAPAVNKWESGSSTPDISLLAPLARLLHITLDELLSFKEELTDREIVNIIRDIDRRFERENLDEVFIAIEELIREYPNAETLILSLTSMLDAHCLFQNNETNHEYDDWIQRHYEQLLNSEDEPIRLSAADCLYSFCVRNEQYEKAEKYLEYFSPQNPERKRKQATIYNGTGRYDEAYKTLEEVVFSEYQSMNGALHGIYMVAMKTGNHEKARFILEKLSGLCVLFDRGEYSRISCELDYAVATKDASQVLKIMDSLLDSTDSLFDFTKSKLYEHMDFKESDSKYMDKVHEDLLEQIRNDETYDFVRKGQRWKAFEKKWYK